MTQEPESPQPEARTEAEEPVRTGAPRVDEVIRAVEELEERPLEEHAGVFESAHGELRRALDDPGHDAGDAGDAVGAGDVPDDHTA